MTVTYVNDGDLATPENVNEWLNRAAHEVFNIKAFGAEGDGATDDSIAVQAALTAATDAGGGLVYAPGGTYILNSPLRISSNTKLVLSDNTIFRRGANTTYMLGNDPGEATGYEGGGGIVIEGGTWDARGDVHTDPMSIVALAHVDGVTMRGARFTNVDNYHMAEFVACRGIRIVDCTFDDFHGAPQDMLQFDQARNQVSFPYFAIVYDNTPCVDVEVRGCTFRDSTGRAIVSHFTGLTDANRDIRIISNYFEGFPSSTVVLVGVSGVVMTGNVFHECQRGVTLIDEVSVGSGTAAVRDEFILSNNVFRTMGSPIASHAIRVESTMADPNQQRYGVIADNVIHDSARHGIVLFWAAGWAIRGNRIHDAGNGEGTGCGILLDASPDCVVEGNVVSGASQAGIRLTRSPRCLVAANKTYENDRAGIMIDNATNDTLVVVNSVTDNSQEATDTYDGILVAANCDRSAVKDNIVRGLTHRYGVNIATNTCEFTWVRGNDLLGAGTTGEINDAGTSSVVEGNRGA